MINKISVNVGYFVDVNFRIISTDIPGFHQNDFPVYNIYFFNFLGYRNIFPACFFRIRYEISDGKGRMISF